MIVWLNQLNLNKFAIFNPFWVSDKFLFSASWLISPKRETNDIIGNNQTIKNINIGWFWAKNLVEETHYLNSKQAQKENIIGIVEKSEPWCAGDE